jgi:hypothetical protein
MSSYEYAVKGNRGQQAKADAAHGGQTLISTSLWVRRQWLRQYDGKGTIPSEIHPKRQPAKAGDHEEEVYLFGQDTVSPALGMRMVEFKL